ncbi:MAG: diacylglycerol kinase family protein [Gemmatimonadota bacterium]
MRGVAPWSIIVNPAAGSGRARRGAEAAARHLRAHGVEVELHLTAGPGHARELAGAIAAGGADRLVVCGGDGTVREVLPAVLESGLPLGLLPQGTANDLARALGLSRSAKGAAQDLLTGRPAAIDVALVNGMPFITVSSFGLDAAVSQAVNEGRLPIPGSAAYVVAALRCLLSFTPPRVRLSGDFGQIEAEVMLVAAANTSSYGGGMRIAPAADPTDGLLDVCVVRRAPRHVVAAVLPRVYWGGHRRHPAVQILRTARLRLEILDGESWPVWADGEYATATPADVEVRQGGLQVIVPLPAPGLATLPGAPELA